MLYIACIIHATERVMPRPIWNSEAVLCCRVCLYDRSIETCHYRGWEPVSDSILYDLHRCRLCTHYINNLLPYTITTMGIWSSIYCIWKWDMLTLQGIKFNMQYRPYPLHPYPQTGMAESHCYTWLEIIRYNRIKPAVHLILEVHHSNFAIN